MCQGVSKAKLKTYTPCPALEAMKLQGESSASSDITNLSEYTSNDDSDCDVTSKKRALVVQYASEHMKAGNPASWASTPISLVTLFFVMGCVYVLLALLPFFWFPPVTLALAVIIGSMLVPKPSESMQDWFQQGNTMFEAWMQYFSMTVSVEYDYMQADPDTHYIITAAPHGAFPISAILTGSYTYKVFRNKTRHLAASCLFFIPLWRYFYQLLSCYGATRDNMKRLLQRGNCLVVIGGIAEMFMLKKDKEQILLSRRKGVIKMAIETGCPIVPTYEFGSSQMTKFGPGWLRDLSSKCRTSLGMVYGRYFLPIPFPTHLHLAIGPPVMVKQMSPADPGFNDAVDRTHAEYMEAVKALYERHKEEYGWGDRPLVVN